MGYTIDAIPSGVNNVRENPMLLAIGYAITIAMIPIGIVAGIVMFVLALVPLVGPIVGQFLVVLPLQVLLLAGTIGVVGKAFTGSVSIGDFTDAVRDNFRSLFGAYALLQVLLTAVMVVLGVVGFLLLGVGAAFSSPTSGSPVAAQSIGLGILVFYLAVFALVFVVTYLFQFVDVAVVLGDHDAIGAFKESLRLVRDAPVSVLGYTFMRGILGLAIVLPGYVVAIAGATVSDALTFVGLGIVLLLYPVAFVVVMSYHAAYYGVRLRSA